MAHDDLQVRPMKIGVQSVARLMSQTGPTRIVCQRTILVVVGRPVHHRSLVPKAAVRTAVPSSAKVVVATGHQKVYKKTLKQPRGQSKQAKSGKTPVAASVAQKRQAPERKSSSDSKRQQK